MHIQQLTIYFIKLKAVTQSTIPSSYTYLYISSLWSFGSTRCHSSQHICAYAKFGQDLPNKCRPFRKYLYLVYFIVYSVLGVLYRTKLYHSIVLVQCGISTFFFALFMILFVVVFVLKHI